MRIKRALKEREFYSKVNRDLPDLQDVEDAAVFLLEDRIRITCTEHYPFRPPVVDVMLNRVCIPYQSLPGIVHLEDYDALTMCKLMRPHLFAPHQWPDIVQCPCCTSVVCDMNWCTLIHMHDVAAECIFWITYIESRDLLQSISLRELPRDILHHMVALVNV